MAVVREQLAAQGRCGPINHDFRATWRHRMHLAKGYASPAHAASPEAAFLTVYRMICTRRSSSWPRRPACGLPDDQPVSPFAPTSGRTFATMKSTIGAGMLFTAARSWASLRSFDHISTMPSLPVV
jgi:hypothetical protein